LETRTPRLTQSLAYFLGYLLGDGCTSAASGNYVVTVSCHSIDEDYFAKNTLVPLVKKLFGVRPCFYKRKNQNAYCMHFGSKRVVSYLTNVVGFPLGQAPKQVPKLVRGATMQMKIAFIRGLFDADGSLVFSKKHHEKPAYPSIELKSVDLEILEWVMGVLRELGLRVSLGRSVESRVLRVNGEDMLESWMKRVGSSNLKHISKYKVWKKYGYCPTNTTVPDRLRLLRTGLSTGKTNIESPVAAGFVPR
jgi:intein/homing endonuclease